MLLAGHARVLIEVDSKAALAALQEALELGREVDDPLVSGLISWLGLVLQAERLTAEAVARLAAGVAALVARSVAVGGRNAIDGCSALQDRAALTQAVAAARETLGEGAFSAAEAAGRALTFDALLEELLAALADGERELVMPLQRAPRFRQTGSLISPREREVLALAVEGHSNRSMAETLFVDPAPSRRHERTLHQARRRQSRPIGHDRGATRSPRGLTSGIPKSLSPDNPSVSEAGCRTCG